MTEQLIRDGKRFNVALSFPGEYRNLVKSVADALSQQLNHEQVFYDKWYEAELARLNLDVYLQSIYRDQAELIVVFLGAEYEKKDWCSLEWRAIRDLIKQKQDETIMLISLDGTPTTGLFGIDGYIDATGRTPVEIGNLILKRLHLNRQNALSSSAPTEIKTVFLTQHTQKLNEQVLGQVIDFPFKEIEKSNPEIEADCMRLQKFLETADWKKADQETGNIVFKACNRSYRETLESEDIRKLPDSIFLVVDQLWLEYSEGRFGFSSQQPIWDDLENLSGVTYKIFQRFSQTVGWCEENSWIKYENLNFNLSAPIGHFPYCRSWIVSTRSTAVAQRFHALMVKVKNSKPNF